MKKSVTLLVVILIPVLLVITGCSKPAVPATAPAAAATTASETAPAAALTEAPVAATAAPTEVSNDAQMEALILEKLQGHHSIDVVLSANKTREEWVRTLDRMIAKGAVISDEEKTLIIDWLLSRKN
jgi:hypothetical protein